MDILFPSSSASLSPSSSTNASSLWSPLPAAAPVPAPAPIPSTTRLLRSRATLKDAGGRPSDDGGGAGGQVDFYVGRTRRDAERVLAAGGGRGKEEEAQGGEETSYMFCPQAFGSMAPGLSSAYWQHVESFLALPEAEQRAARRRLLVQQQQQEEEEEGEEQQQQQKANRTTAAAATAAVSGGDGSGSGNGDPRLLLLVPARSVDWAGGAGGRQPPQHWQGREGVEEEGEEAWLEVGCRLTSIRLVNDVRFPAASA